MFVSLGELRWSFCSEDSVFLAVGYKAVGSTTTLTVLRGKVVAKKNYSQMACCLFCCLGM